MSASSAPDPRRWVQILSAALAATAMAAAAVVLPTSAILGARTTKTDIDSGEDRRRLVSDITSCPWLNSSLSVAQRVRLLEASMTPTDEATMMHLEWGTNPYDPYEGQTAAIPRLCIPQITEDDGGAGVGSGWYHVGEPTYPEAFDGATQLPAPIADAAAFDPSLARSYGRVVGAEDAAVGVDVALAPTVNIERDPLWGRAYESLGEDPYLSGTLGVQLVEGIQSQRVVAVVKHLVAYNQETNRGTRADDDTISKRALREIFLPAFSATVQQARPGGVMCSYALIDGVPSCEDQALLEGTLRHQWHFRGFVRSDCGSVFNGLAAIAAGVSQAKCGDQYSVDRLVDEMDSGQLPRANVNAVLTPLLTTLFDDNLIAQPHVNNPYGVVTNAADQSVALTTDNQGAVLMKNDGILPLHFDELSSVALIGDDYGTPMPAGFGAMHVKDESPVTALDALKAVLGENRLIYEPGSDLAAAVDAARRARVAIVVAHDVESEGVDRTSLTLPNDQDQLIEDVERVNPRTVVVLETGAPVLMPWLANTPAVLETWYPGQQAGTSLVQLLSGEVDPSGKSPVTWPATADARPDTSAADFGGVHGHVDYNTDGIDVGYRWYQVHNVTPALDFGDGLSYTTFAFSHPAARRGVEGTIDVSATITNTGAVAGADVVQCYVGLPAATGEPPRQLKGFLRVSLDPGQARRVTMVLTRGDLAYWDTATREWRISGGRYRIWVGDGSDLAHLPLTTTVSLRARSLGVDSGPAPGPAPTSRLVRVA